MEILTLKGLVEKIAGRTGLTQVDTKIVVESMIMELKEAFVGQKKVNIKEFGVFQPYYRKSRSIKNPSTGEMMETVAKWTLKFKPAKGMDIIEQKQAEALDKAEINPELKSEAPINLNNPELKQEPDLKSEDEAFPCLDEAFVK